MFSYQKGYQHTQSVSINTAGSSSDPNGWVLYTFPPSTDEYRCIVNDIKVSARKVDDPRLSTVDAHHEFNSMSSVMQHQLKCTPQTPQRRAEPCLSKESRACMLLEFYYEVKTSNRTASIQDGNPDDTIPSDLRPVM